MMPAHNTSVMILAAGRGKRMRPLTDKTAKPLLKVGHHALIEHHLLRLSQQGFEHVVINVDWCADAIKKALGNGANYGLKIDYSDESDTGALETAGGIKKALPLINSETFIVINGDIWTDYLFSNLLNPVLDNEARLVLVENPEHNSNGDFGLQTCADQSANPGLLTNTEPKWTFSGMACYQKTFFDRVQQSRMALGEILRCAIAEQAVEGLLYQGIWNDIGTPQRLAEINQQLRNNATDPTTI